MSIFNSREKTYPFSLEGLAQMKADNNFRNKIKDCDLLISGLTLGISIVGLCLICSSLSSMVAFKSIEIEASQVAYKVIEGIL